MALERFKSMFTLFLAILCISQSVWEPSNPWQGLCSNMLPSFRDIVIKTTQIEILPETHLVFNIIKNLCYMPRELQVTGQSINITSMKWSCVYEGWQWIFHIDINVTRYNVMVTEATRCSSGISGKVEIRAEDKINSSHRVIDNPSWG